MKINEIFYSLQGEGKWAGTAAIFIRFAGCNLSCDFCDTRHQHYKIYTEAEIVREIAKYAHCGRVVLTGGEPSLQVTEELLGMLHDNGYHIAMETNGTRPLPSGIDWVTCSPKFEFCKNAEIKLGHIDELKVVYKGRGQDMSRYEEIEAGEYYLQPCDTGDAETNTRIIEDTVDYIKQHPKWKLSIQTQKILGIR